MQNFSKRLLATFLCVGACVLPASAQIFGVGIHFQGDGTALASTDSAGLASVAQMDWNVVTGASFSSVPLLQSNGAPGGTLNGSANGPYFGGGSSALPAGN